MVYDVTSRQSAHSYSTATHCISLTVELSLCQLSRLGLHDAVLVSTSTAPISRACSGFTNARSWLADVRQHADPHLTCILVGNKVDLVSDDAPSSASTTDKSAKRTSRSQATRQVTTEEAEQWAKEEGLLFVEASAKSGTNVQEAFEEACKDILK